MSRTSSFNLTPTVAVRLVRVDEGGQEVSRHPMPGAEVVVGRENTEIAFEDDTYLSPRHAQLSFRDSRLFVRDLGSRNGTWFFIEGPHRMQDGDLILIGSQILRYRRLGYPGPAPPEADATRRLGSLTPSADIASLTQLRGDGSGRDVTHLSPGRNITIGRDQGDWLFSYDPSMSGLHAQIRSEDADFTIVDAGSRNGVAVAVRGERELANGSRFLVGDKMLRVEFA
jgi:pSer/pThr/pTyr-binding forkhead associated (FHA) protein